jgi:hypothetical protein
VFIPGRSMYVILFSHHFLMFSYDVFNINISVRVYLKNELLCQLRLT